MYTLAARIYLLDKTESYTDLGKADPGPAEKSVFKGT